MPPNPLHAAQRAQRHARTFAEWQQAAAEADRQSGADAWRADDRTPLLDAPQMRRHVRQLEDAVARGDEARLHAVIYESLYRHMGDVANPQLYVHAQAGTKDVVEAYLGAVEAGLRALAGMPGLGAADGPQRDALRLAAFNLGRPALLFSGGASMGFLHLGVAKALHGENLLPDVLSGSSMGALIAAGIASRTPAERHALFDDPDQVNRLGLRFLGPRAMLARGAVLNNHQLLRCAWRNIGDCTFAEAFARSGISLGISVSPARAHQKPRLLSHLSSPDVLLPRAALASCAVPGLFPAVRLRARTDRGRQPYLPADRWVDGSVHSDLPMQRLARLFNVNQFIVSQTNPHSVPFLASRHGAGVGALLVDTALSSARAQFDALLSVARERVRQPFLRNLVEQGHALAAQSYRGDINLHPPLSPWLYRRLLANPTPADLRRYILLGERIAWPKLAMIRNVTRISRAVRELDQGLDRADGLSGR